MSRCGRAHCWSGHAGLGEHVLEGNRRIHNGTCPLQSWSRDAGGGRFRVLGPDHCHAKPKAYKRRQKSIYVSSVLHVNPLDEQLENGN